MQVNSWKYMFQTNENYNNIQKPTKKQNVKDIPHTNCKIKYAIYFMECTYNMQPTVCR